MPAWSCTLLISYGIPKSQSRSFDFRLAICDLEFGIDRSGLEAGRLSAAGPQPSILNLKSSITNCKGVCSSMPLKVMVVDDEPDVLKTFKAIVESLGFEVLTVADSGEAARRLTSEKVDGIFLDARMPHPDGFELAQAVRASSMNSGAPIVMLTGYGDAETMRKGFEAGITFFMSKPIRQERLSGMLRVMHGPMLREKRRHARLPFTTTVTCTMGGQVTKSQSVNISEGGMLLESSGGASVGHDVDLAFALPQSPRPLRARAKVVRKEPPDRIGVQFRALEPEDREAIQRYITGRVKD